MNNELIEAAKAVIARWDSTDWKAAPTAEVMNRLRAALSAKPELVRSQYQVEYGPTATPYEPAKPEPLPDRVTTEDIQQLENLAGRLKGYREDNQAIRNKIEPLPEVEEWIARNTFEMDERFIADLRTYLHQLTAAHKAAIASEKREHRYTKLLLDQMAHNYKQADACAHEREIEIFRLDRELKAAEAKGRREALQSVPVDALSVALVGLRAMGKDGAIGTGDRLGIANTIADTEKLLESARAAQAEQEKKA